MTNENTEMAWDEPNGGDKDRGKRDPRDPWSGGRRSEGPPELDEVVRKLQESLRRLFGGGRGDKQGSGGSGKEPSPKAYFPLALLVGVVVLLSQMFYVIQPAEKGVVTRFGRYVTTLDPGWAVRLPRPIERVEKVNADRVQSAQINASMFTKDNNIAVVDLEVQYRVKNAKDYLYSVKGPDELLRQATEASLREIIGANTIDFALKDGRQEIAQATKERLQGILDQHGSGLTINQVNYKEAKVPQEVQAAFDDAIKANQDYDRLINEAESYRNEVVPKARGGAARQRAEAAAYKAQVTSRAEGEANRFRQLLAQYQKAPQVTRERLYLDTMEAVLGNSAKVVVDAKAGNQMFYLPLDRLMQSTGQNAGPAVPAPRSEDELTTEFTGGSTAAGADIERDRSAARERERR